MGASASSIIMDQSYMAFAGGLLCGSMCVVTSPKNYPRDSLALDFIGSSGFGFLLGASLPPAVPICYVGTAIYLVKQYLQ